MILKNKVKIRRLEHQIELLEEQIKTSRPGIQERLRNAIKRRKEAIQFISENPKDMTWEKIQHYFDIDIYFVLNKKEKREKNTGLAHPSFPSRTKD